MTEEELIRRLVPRNSTMREYYEATDRKHFQHHPSNPQPVGSQFTNPHIRNLEDLLTLAIAQRENKLDGDDRHLLIDLGAEPEAFKDNIRYLLVKTSGTVGIQSSNELDDSTEVTILVTKPNTPPNPTIIGYPKPETNIGTIIIGRNDGDTKNNHEILYTAHPGLPIPTYADHLFTQYTNQTIPLGELKKLTGLNHIWLQIREN